MLQDVEELMGLAPEKVLLKWMNFHLKKAGYKKPITNFSSDLKVWLLLLFSSSDFYLFFHWDGVESGVKVSPYDT